MAVSALGLPFLLQANNTQLDSLFAGLTAGDTVRGRVVEILGGDKAVVSLRGQNMVAQLPAGSSLQKGDALLLQVTQVQSAETGQAATLTLRLLPNAGADLAIAAGAAQAQTPASRAVPAQAVLEQALSGARLPVNSVTLSAAQTLARLGAPLDPASLQQAVQNTEALLANEAPAQAAAPPSQPAVDLSVLKEGLAQLTVAAHWNAPSQDGVLLLQAARQLAQALEPAPSPAPGREAPLATAGLAGEAVQPQATAPGPAGPLSLPQAQQAVQTAVAAVLAQPSPASVEALSAALARLPLAEAAAMPATEPPSGTRPGTEASVGSTNAAPIGQAPVATTTPFQVSLPSLPARREAMVQLLAQPAAQGDAQTGAVRTAPLAAQAESLDQAYRQPESAPSRALVAAVLAQQPDAVPAQILSDARQGLTGLLSALRSPQSPAVLPSPAALRNWLQEGGQALPQLNLSQLPPEHVAEAVAWLQARDLPPQRPLVEAVAAWIDQDQTALPATRSALHSAQALPSELVSARPSLGQAIEQLQGALDLSTLQPESPDLAQRLSQWSQAQGLDLESRLGASDPLPGNGTAGAAAAAWPAQGHGAPAQDLAVALKPALLRLTAELKAAMKDPLAQSPQVARHLDALSQQTQAAVQAMNAVPLQAQAAPAFDSVHLSLPVWMSGPLGDGKLSVTWRHGRERQLDDDEPVNVVVALNTESLGPVKVQLQVWKGNANARVIGIDPAAAQYLAGGADDLRRGFAERTPFKLQTLEFAATEGGPQASGPEAGSAPGAGGFDLSA
jgi:hypothetical protein